MKRPVSIRFRSAVRAPKEVIATRGGATSAREQVKSKKEIEEKVPRFICSIIRYIVRKVYWTKMTTRVSA